MFFGYKLNKKGLADNSFVQFMLFRNESLKLNDKVLKEVVPSKVFFNIITKKINKEITKLIFRTSRSGLSLSTVLHKMILSHRSPSVATAVCGRSCLVRVQVCMEF